MSAHQALGSFLTRIKDAAAAAAAAGDAGTADPKEEEDLPVSANGAAETAAAPEKEGEAA